MKLKALALLALTLTALSNSSFASVTKEQEEKMIGQVKPEDFKTFSPYLHFFKNNLSSIAGLAIINPEAFKKALINSWPVTNKQNLNVEIARTYDGEYLIEFEVKIRLEGKLQFSSTLQYLKEDSQFHLALLIGKGILPEFAIFNREELRYDLGFYVTVRGNSESKLELSHFNFSNYQKLEVANQVFLQRTVAYNLDFNTQSVFRSDEKVAPFVNEKEENAYEKNEEREKKLKIKVAILDTGIDYNHPALRQKLTFFRPENIIQRNEIKKENMRLRQLIELKKIQDNTAYNRFLDFLSFTTGHSTYELKFATETIQMANLNRLERATAEGILEDLSIGYDVNPEHSGVENLGLPYDKKVNEADLEIEGHGTHVAGIASANDQIGIFPIGKEIKDLNRALNLAREKGVRVVNISLGNYSNKSWATWLDAIQKNRDIVFVVAAGNDSLQLTKKKCEYYPTCFNEENIIRVAATDQKGKLASFSNTGAEYVELGANGVDVDSTYIDGTRAKLSGTSMAAPQVTRAVARMLIANPKLTVLEIKSILKNTVTKTVELKNKTIYGGNLNEEMAVSAAANFKVN